MNIFLNIMNIMTALSIVISIDTLFADDDIILVGNLLKNDS